MVPITSGISSEFSPDHETQKAHGRSRAVDPEKTFTGKKTKPQSSEPCAPEKPVSTQAFHHDTLRLPLDSGGQRDILLETQEEFSSHRFFLIRRVPVQQKTEAVCMDAKLSYKDPVPQIPQQAFPCTLLRFYHRNSTTLSDHGQ